MVIPGGCTSQFQAPDVSWNAPLKNKMQKSYDQWWLTGEKSYTKHNNIRAPKKTDVVDMVLKSWNAISEELIHKSFVACGQTKDAKAIDITCMKKGRKLDFIFDDIEKIFKNPTLFEGTLSEQNFLPDDFELECNEVIIFDDEEETIQEITFCCVICEGLKKSKQAALSPQNQLKALEDAKEKARLETEAAKAEAEEMARIASKQQRLRPKLKPRL